MGRDLLVAVLNEIERHLKNALKFGGVIDHLHKMWNSAGNNILTVSRVIVGSPAWLAAVKTMDQTK